jgi:hypothetical protein
MPALMRTASDTSRGFCLVRGGHVPLKKNVLHHFNNLGCFLTTALAESDNITWPAARIVDLAFHKTFASHAATLAFAVSRFA